LFPTKDNILPSTKLNALTVFNILTLCPNSNALWDANKFVINVGVPDPAIV
jgi:hypothetical protein